MFWLTDDVEDVHSNKDLWELFATGTNLDSYRERNPNMNMVLYHSFSSHYHTGLWQRKCVPGDVEYDLNCNYAKLTTKNA